LVYPNPSNGTTLLPKVSFYISQTPHVITVKIYTVNSRLVRKVNFWNGIQPGRNDLEIEQKYLSGLSSGIYFYVIIGMNHDKKKCRSSIEKMVLLK